MRFTQRLRRNRLAKPVVPALGQLYTFPAPTRGWNARDPLIGMKPTDAIVLDNYIPTTADVRLRGGSEPWATGMPDAPVETVMEYSDADSDELWAICDGEIYDVTAQAAVGAAAVTGLTNSRWQFTQFQTSSAVGRLVLVNGEDDMLQYDGTTWHVINGVSAPIAITGVPTADLVQVWVFKQRLFFVEINTMNAWYLDVDSYGGAATKINLGTLFKRGGYLMTGGTWTRDGGDGMDDLCIFISSHGEVAIYQGSDPSDPDFWGLIGRYDIGAPIGRRCLIRTGADLGIVCLDGVQGLSNIITLDRAATNKVALSDRIRNAFNQAAQLYKDNFGWEAVAYPWGNQVWFNIPIGEATTQYQYVLNTTTSAWCRFKGMNANTWCLHNERLYFGNNSGEVWIADEGESDNNEDIEGVIKTAFIYHAGKAVQKAYKMARPLIFSDISLVYSVALAVDFDDTVLAASSSSGVASGFSIWDIATWDVDPWATIVPIQQWKNTPVVGVCASVIFRTNTRNYSITLNAVDVLFEVGEIL